MKQTYKLFASLTLFALFLSGCNDASKHVHTFDENWSFDETYHWHSATCQHTSEISDQEEHIFGSWIIDKEASESDKGLRHKECSVCSFQISEEIDKIQHVHTNGTPIEENRNEATCTEDGSYDLVTYCTTCFEEVSRVHHVLTALGHDLVHHDGRAPTCTESGFAPYDTCSRCDYTTYQSLAPTGHVNTSTREENRNEATCTKDGSYDLVTYCLDDGVELSREHKTISALGHNYNCVETPATYDADGILTYTCSRCGDIYTEKGDDQLIHTFDNNWSFDEHKHWYACLDDGFENLKENEADHIFNDVVTPATGTSGGYTTHTCSVCGYSYIDQETEPLKYTVIWKNWDGTVLETDTNLSYGDIPSYKGEQPVKEKDSTNSYIFVGWDHEIETITSDMVFTAVFDAGYEITWKNWDGTILHIDVIRDGDMPEFTGNIPEHERNDEDGEYSYVFTGWNEEITVAHSNKTYTACFERKYLFEFSSVSTYYILDKCIDSSVKWVSVPKKYKGFPVKEIAKGAFQNCQSIESMDLPFVGQSESENTFLAYIFGGNDESATSTYVPNSLRQIRIMDGCENLGNQAFSRCNNLISVVLPNSLTSIGNQAFKGCSGLTSIDIPSSVTTFGNSAFENCSSLSAITIPNTVISLGQNCFYGCSSLTEVVVPTNVTSMGKGLFQNCSSLYSLTIPFVAGSIEINGYTTSQSNPFLGYLFGASSNSQNSTYVPSSLKNVVVSEGTNYIAEVAFGGCSSLTSITIPKSVTFLGGSCFRNCSSLETLTIPFVGESKTSSYKYIGYNFGIGGSNGYNYNKKYVSPNLKNLIINEGCNSLATYALYDCSSIISISLPSTLTDIGSNALQKCSSLSTVVFNRSSQLSTIGTGAFSGCPSTNYYFHGTYEKWLSVEGKGYLYVDSQDSVHLFCENDDAIETTSIDINEGITSIPNYGFVGCKSLTSVVVPDSVTSIKTSAFENCTSLTSVILPNTITSIGNSAFAYCTSLESITIPASVTSIDSNAFLGCTSLTSITLPSSIQSLGMYVFKNCTSLSSVTIQDGVTGIGGNTFENCVSLKTITIPSSITSLGTNLFRGCTSLEKVQVLGQTVEISGYLFYGCTSLTSVSFAEGPSQICDYAFCMCSSLTNIIIPESVTTIRNNAFAGCSSLEYVELSDNITTIGNKAFSDCTSLSAVVLPSSITTIGTNAFNNCPNITHFYYKGTIEQYLAISIGDQSGLSLDKLYIYSETQPLEDGNYWHYVNGEIVIW